MAPKTAAPLTASELTAIWCDLNQRYFAGALPSIDLRWSRRLTSSVGMFVSRGGPRSAWKRAGGRQPRREIRLSLPLLTPLLARSPYGRHELVSTLAHEMIHQWQFDLLKRRPNHGPDFLRKMTEMNRDGELAITVYHSLQQEVLALARFTWRCRRCGRVYRRQRRTIKPRRHHCGTCRGSLQELRSSIVTRHPSCERNRKPSSGMQQTVISGQLKLDFSFSPTRDD